MLLEHDYIHADPPKSLPPIPVRVTRRSQLTVALHQHVRPIVIEDQELAGPFVRLLRARQLRLWGLGEFVANTMSCGIDQSYGANVEAHCPKGGREAAVHLIMHARGGIRRRNCRPVRARRREGGPPQIGRAHV